MENEITSNGFIVKWQGDNVTRWQKYGKDRLYMGDKSKIFVDLSDLENEISTTYQNPYGWKSRRIVENGEIVGVIHEHGHNSIEIRKSA